MQASPRMSLTPSSFQASMGTFSMDTLTWYHQVCSVPPPTGRQGQMGKLEPPVSMNPLQRARSFSEGSVNSTRKHSGSCLVTLPLCLGMCSCPASAYDTYTLER
jgi:hypothetical protein